MNNWQPPSNYQPDPNLEAILKTTSPKLNTPLFDMVVYWDWRTRPLWRKTIKQAWDNLGMTPEHAREAIDQQLVLTEIYDKAERRALEED
jgi:hypothetical protein